MRKIPKKLVLEMQNDDYYKCCARHAEGTCKGRVTWEHALVYGSQQVTEKWAIIPLCEYHHAVNIYQDCGDLDKEKNVWIALNRATNEELAKYSKVINYQELRDRLNTTHSEILAINY